MMLFHTWRTHLDRLALPLAVVGLAAIGWHNWRQWQRDKAMLAQRVPPERLPPLENWPRLPRVSVLVAAWNEAAHIEQHIQSFLSLRYPHKELILCAGGKDDTYQIACRYAGEQVTVLEQQPGAGKQRALAQSLHHATGEIIFLTDAGCMPDNASFEHTVWPLANEGEQAANGNTRPLPMQLHNPFVLVQWYSVNYGRYRHTYTKRYIQGLQGRNAAISRELVRRTGDFTADVHTGTDYYLAHQILQLGVQIRYVHDSIIPSVYEMTLRAYMRQQTRWIRNILLHGPRFGTSGQLQARIALRQCLVGLVVTIWSLLLPLLGRIGLISWLLIIAQGVCSRFRYIRFGERLFEQPRRPVAYLLAPLLLLLDQVMLSYSLISWRIPQLRWQW
jgi:cellulose synthase/poly-beta-1,6-N-acetylglucosamine synthase-like glycosyltransferase